MEILKINSRGATVFSLPCAVVGRYSVRESIVTVFTKQH